MNNQLLTIKIINYIKYTILLLKLFERNQHIAAATNYK